MSVPEYPRERQVSHRKPTMRRDQKDRRSPLLVLVGRCLLAFVLTLGLLPLPALADELQNGSEAAAGAESSEQSISTEQGSSSDASEAKPDNVTADSAQATLPDGETSNSPNEEEPPLTSLIDEGVPSQDNGTESSDGIALQSDSVQEGPQITASGTLETGLVWEYRDDASLVIKGTGDMPDFTSVAKLPWNNYIHLVEKVIVEEGVTSIGDYAFSDCDFLGHRVLGGTDETVVLPSTLTRIGKRAFYDCDALESIVVSDSVEEIGEYAFASCDKLRSCKLPASLQVVERGLLEKDYKLEEVNIPEGVTTIKATAFSQEYSGTDPRSGIKTIVFPASLTAIEPSAFKSCLIDSDLVIPATLETVSTTTLAQSFNNMVVTGTLTFQDGVRDVVLKNFQGQGQQGHANKIVYPASAKSVSYFKAVESYEVDEGNPVLTAQDGCLYSNKGVKGTYGSNTAVLMAVPTSRTGILEVPEGTKELTVSFLTESLSALSLPASLTFAFDESSYNWGLNSALLTDIHVSAENDTYSSQDGVLFTKDGSRLIRCPVGHAFTNGEYLVPDRVAQINGYAFNGCANLRSVSLPEGLARVEGSTFSGCKNLICAYIPASVSSMGTSAFNAGSSPLTIFFGGDADQWKAINIHQPEYNGSNFDNATLRYNALGGGETGNGLIFWLGSDHVFTVERNAALPSPGTAIASNANGRWQRFATDAGSIVIENGITTVGNNAFKGFEATDAVIPASVTRVVQGAFFQCPSLKSVECKGAPFAVVAASSSTPSFPATVTLLSYQGNGWADHAAYDADAQTWNGYALVEVEPEDLPQIDSVRFTSNGESVSGVTIAGGRPLSTQNIKVTVLDEEGRDITSAVSLSLASPERTASLKVNETGDGAAFKVQLGGNGASLIVGNVALAGDYILTATPIALQTGGDAKDFTFTVEREPERVMESYSWQFGSLTGRRAGGNLTRELTMDVWNQYYETVMDRCEVELLDTLSGNQDVTARHDELGIYLDELKNFKLAISELALPRDYWLRFISTDDSLSGWTGVYFSISRSASLLNVPYGITLLGGDETIERSAEEQWASTPYRVRVLDCYDDPVWPDLTWKVVDPSGADVTQHFAVDEQGYLHTVKADELLASYGDGTVFKITASTAKTSSSSQVLTSNALNIVYRDPEVVLPPVTHTATFVVGDEVIGQVTFTEGDTSLDEPTIPQKQNYTGSWEPYNLAEATGDITIQGVYRPIDPSEVSDIEASADSSYDKGEVAITLTAAAKSKKVRIESKTTKPVDVVLVLDQSGSMKDPLGKSKTKKYEALTECAKSFVDNLYENALKTGADHRVALVGFGSASNGSIAFKNTELLSTMDGGPVAYTAKGIKQSVYERALVPISVNGQLNQRITEGIKSIDAEGATAADLGLEMAGNIFAANPVVPASDGPSRKRVVVFITDGVPTSKSNSYSDTNKKLIKETAAGAISRAHEMKSSQDVQIYSIGVEAGANPSQLFSGNKDGVGASYVKDADGSKIVDYDFNRFLHLVSSNYPEATSMDSHGQGSRDGGYYMAVNQTENLSSIFSNILYSTVYSVESFDHVTLRYTLPASFTLTMKQEEEMRANLTALGLGDENIIASEVDGATTLTFKNVPVQPQNVNGIENYIASVTFKVSATRDAQGNVDAGEASVDKGGQITNMVVPSVTVPTDRCLVVFKVNDAIYEICDANMGDPIQVPATDLARWMDLEMAKDPHVTGPYAVFETSTLTREYSVRWIVGENELTETYKPGASLSVPDEVLSWVPKGYEIGGWSPVLPATMPARNISCVAVLTPEHEHDYAFRTATSGSCIDGITTHHFCSCGESTTEQAAAKDHSYTAQLSSAGNSKGTTVEYLKCTDCGNIVEKYVTYQVSKKGSNTVLDLNNYKSEVLTNGPSNDSISMRFYFPEARNGATYKVVRIDPDGTKTLYEAKIVDGYLVFFPNHFSIYMIAEQDPDDPTKFSTDDMSYQDALDILANPDPDPADDGDENDDFNGITGEEAANKPQPGGEQSGEQSGEQGNQQGDGQAGAQNGTQNGGGLGGSQVDNGGEQPAGDQEEPSIKPDDNGADTTADSGDDKSPSQTKVDVRTALSQTGDSAHLAIAACGLLVLAALVLLLVARRLASTRKRL